MKLNNLFKRVSFAVVSVAMAVSLSGCFDLFGSSTSSDASVSLSVSELEKTLRSIYDMGIEQGAIDSSVTYEQWLASIKGADGVTPHIGDNGDWYIGDTDTGVKAKGETGEKGSDGSSVYTGSGLPSSNIGKDGDSYIDTSTWDYYVKSNGAWTKTGNIKGSTGDKGSDGSSVLTGEGVPASDLGKDGDTYIDTSTWDSYIKSEGAWAKTGNIKGGKGDKGEDAVTYIPCIFNNYDDTKLYEFYYEKGSDIVYDGPVPTKPSSIVDGYTANWSFSGWDKALTNIQKPTIFKAQFKSQLLSISFVNYDGTALYSTKVNFGEDVTYGGVTPTKPSTVSGSSTIEWTFSGWDKPLTNLKTDTVFTAQFNAPNAIKCTFNNYDGSLLGYEYCGLNANVAYSGQTPTKAETNDGSGTVTRYEFTGWDKSLKSITTDTTFTAQFLSTVYYECKFKNYDDSLLYTSYVFKGGQAVYVGETPTRSQSVSGTTVTTYAFSVWDKALSNITAPTVFTAVYTSNSFTGYKVTFLASDSTELYSYYCKEGDTAVYPYSQPFSYDSTTVNQFCGWSSSLKSISANTTVTEVVKSVDRKKIGEYPQTKVTNSTLKSALSNVTTTNTQGYYIYDNEKYEKSGSDYYKVEPIQWRYCGEKDGNSLMISEKLLDYQVYNATTHATGIEKNNYKYSDIRSWLNGTFFDKAFFSDDSLVMTTAVDNSVSSTGYTTNPYVCETTNDKVFLLSYSEVTSADYGFSVDSDRAAAKTDYYTGTDSATWWWLRSPNNYYSFVAMCIRSNGLVHQGDGGDYVHGYCGVRPAVEFNFD
jgi:hypothetical protein